MLQNMRLHFVLFISYLASAISAVEDYLVISLGGQTNDKTLALDTTTYAEKSLNIRVSTRGHASIFFEHLIIVCGGFDGTLGSHGAITDGCFAYNTTIVPVDTTVTKTEFGVTSTVLNARSNVEVTLNTNENINMRPMPLALQYFSIAYYGNHLYVIGGDYKNEEGKRIKSGKVYRSRIVMVDMSDPTYDEKMILRGNSSDQLELDNRLRQNSNFKLDQGDWEDVPDLLVARSSVNCQVVLGTLYCFGGITQDGSRSKAMDIFRKNDPTTWHVGAEMTKERSSFSSAVYKDRIYATGGKSGVDVDDTIDVYNTYTARWSLLGMTLTYPRYYHSTFVINDLLMVRGGTNEEGAIANKAQRSLEFYSFQNPGKRFQSLIKYDSKVLHTSVVVPKVFKDPNRLSTNIPIIVGIVVGAILGCMCISACCWIFCKYYCDCVGDEFSDYEDEGRPNHGASVQYGLSTHASQDYYE